MTKAKVEEMALDAVAKFLDLDLDEFLPKSEQKNMRYVLLQDQATIAANVLNAIKDAH